MLFSRPIHPSRRRPLRIPVRSMSEQLRASGQQIITNRCATRPAAPASTATTTATGEASATSAASASTTSRPPSAPTRSPSATADASSCVIRELSTTGNALRLYAVLAYVPYNYFTNARSFGRDSQSRVPSRGLRSLCPQKLIFDVPPYTQPTLLKIKITPPKMVFPPKKNLQFRKLLCRAPQTQLVPNFSVTPAPPRPASRV